MEECSLCFCCSVKFKGKSKLISAPGETKHLSLGKTPPARICYRFSKIYKRIP